MLEPRYKNEGYQLPIQAWYPDRDEFSQGDCFIDFDTLEDAEQFANDLLADVEKLRTESQQGQGSDWLPAGIPEFTNYDD